MIWWILLAVAVLGLGLVLRKRRHKGTGGGAVDQRDVDRVRRDGQSKGFGSM